MQYPFYSMDHISRVSTRVNPADRARNVEDWYQKATPFLSNFSAIRQSVLRDFCLGGEGTFAKKQRLIVGYRTKEARLIFQ